MELRHVDPKTLLDNPNNPRRTKTDDAEDRRLAYSIKAAGLIHPPVVRALEDGTLMIVAGHRRKSASGAKETQDPIAAHVEAAAEQFREGFCRSDAERAHFDSHVTFVGVGA